MKTQTIPQTDSIREVARFWDTHDLTDLEDQLEEVKTPIFERHEPDQVVSVYLAPSEADAVDRIARSQGTSPGILIHEWVVQKLNEV